MNSSRNLDNWWLLTGTLTHDLVLLLLPPSCTACVTRSKSRSHRSRGRARVGLPHPPHSCWLLDAHENMKDEGWKTNERYKLSNVNHFASRKLLFFSFFFGKLFVLSFSFFVGRLFNAADVVVWAKCVFFSGWAKAISFSKQQNSNSQTKLFTNFCGTSPEGWWRVYDTVRAKLKMLKVKLFLSVESCLLAPSRWKQFVCLSKMFKLNTFSTFSS